MDNLDCRMAGDVWYIPLQGQQTLIYAPFHGITILANRAMAETVGRCLKNGSEPVPEDAPWVETLRRSGNHPGRRHGGLNPVFLGLIPTRGCMMKCAYCDFAALQRHPSLSFDMVRKAIDGYAELMQNKQARNWNIHFFGGEPFAAFKEVVFAVNYALKKASSLGIKTHFEVTTNGYYSKEKAGWIAENIDTVVLSLDGFPETQNLHRPSPDGKESFSTVCQNADIFSRGSCELIIRSCVSSENVEKLPIWAAFLAERWFPEKVCFEPMVESPLARKNGLTPPDPIAFERNWAAACKILAKEKIRLIFSSGDIDQVKNSLCPIGQDALIVSSGGSVGGCWQLLENQYSSGTDLQFGCIDSEGLQIDSRKLENQRQIIEHNRNRCRNCFCYAHCAGGCVLQRDQNGNFCHTTKILTLWQLLDQINSSLPADEILADRTYIEWLASREDFSDWNAVFPQETDKLPDITANDKKIGAAIEHSSLALQPVSADPICGWLRAEEKILITNLAEKKIKILEGPDALRFQMEHSGMNDADVAAVWAALSKEPD